MPESLTPIGFSLLFSFALTRLLIPLAPVLGLIDIPSSRKKHSGEIPLIGGIAIYGSVLICTMLFTQLQLELLSIISIGGLLMMVGALDDKMGLSPRFRLLVQFFAGVLLVYGAGIELNSLGNLFGLGAIELGMMSLPFTAIGIAALSNAYNMTDGIDGLAASLGIVAFSFFLLSVGNKLNQAEALILCFYIVALTIYLFFNFAIKPIAPTKVFMGDAGSMFIGFSIAAFAIYFTQSNRFDLKPAIVIWFVAIPLFDMFATMIRRIRKGQSPFYPDRTHLHHLLMHIGLNGKQALASIILFSITLSGIGALIDTYKIEDHFSFIGFILIFIVYLQVILHAWRVKRLLQ